jgi:hypothetical protein
MDTYVKAISLARLPISDKLFEDNRQATREDRQLSILLSYLRDEWPNSRRQALQEVPTLWDSRHMFSCVKGVIFRGDQVVIPKLLQMRMLERAHEGHLRAVKSKARARGHMWWQRMSRNINDMVMRCDVCADFRSQQRKEPLMSTTCAFL